MTSTQDVKADSVSQLSKEAIPEVGFTPGPQMLNIRKVIPNSLTVLATVVGSGGIFFGMNGRYEDAVKCVLLAGVLDGADGPVARALKGTTRFGAELDSLSDYVNFGVSPALLLFYWCFQSWGVQGWCISLLFIICMACRLARFNAGVDLNVNSPLTKNFFLGVPAPAGSLLVLLPLICYFQFKAAVFADPYYVSGWTVFVAYLLVARIPTFSSKMTAALFTPVSLPKLLLITVIAAALLVSLALHLWLTLLSLSLLYVLSFPFSFAAFLLVARNIKKNSKNS